jgi:hypothetical protein
MWWYLTALVTVCYIIYVYQVYRYSSGNIGNKILAKYTVGKKPPSALFYNYADASVTADNTKAAATMLLKDKVTQVVQSSERVVLRVTPECAFYDPTCIRV